MDNTRATCITLDQRCRSFMAVLGQLSPCLFCTRSGSACTLACISAALSGTLAPIHQPRSSPKRVLLGPRVMRRCLVFRKDVHDEFEDAHCGGSRG